MDSLRMSTVHIEAKLKRQRPFCIQVYTSNSTSQYLGFVDKVVAALQREATSESTLLLGDFNAHVGTDERTWKLGCDVRPPKAGKAAGCDEIQSELAINPGGILWLTRVCQVVWRLGKTPRAWQNYSW